MLKHLLIVPVLLLAVSANAQPITFQKTIGGPNDEVAYSVQQTADGGYVLAGYTKSYGPGSFENAYLVKTDSLGDVSWTKTYGVAGGASKAHCAWQTSDGGYILAGYIYQSAATGYDVLLVKTDANGNAQWTKIIGGTGADSAMSITVTSDGGFLITGSSSSFGSGEVHMFLVKTNGQGIISWAKATTHYNPCTNSNTSLWGFESISTSAGEFITLSAYGFLVKSTAGGIPLFLKYIDNGAFTGLHAEKRCAVVANSSGGFMMATKGQWAGGVDIALTKLDSNFNAVWSKSFGSNALEYATSIYTTIDRGYAIAGTSYSFGLGDADVYLIKSDSNGNHQWSKTFGAAGDDFGHAVQGTSDNGLVIVANTYSFGNSSDIYLIKTDSLGNSGCHQTSTATNINPGSTAVATVPPVTNAGGTVNSFSITSSDGGTDSTLCSSITSLEEIFVQHKDAVVYPNPADNQLTIEYTKAGRFELTDMLGRVVAGTVMEAGQNNITINTSLFPSGVYVYCITDEAGRQQAGKVVIAH